MRRPLFELGPLSVGVPALALGVAAVVLFLLSLRASREGVAGFRGGSAERFSRAELRVCALIAALGMILVAALS